MFLGGGVVNARLAPVIFHLCGVPYPRERWLALEGQMLRARPSESSIVPVESQSQRSDSHPDQPTRDGAIVPADVPDQGGAIVPADAPGHAQGGAIVPAAADQAIVPAGAAKYAGLSYEALLAIVVRRDDELDRKNVALRAERQKRRRLEQQLVEADADASSDEDVHEGTSLAPRWLVSHSGRQAIGAASAVSIGIRRNLSNIGARGMGMVLMQDISQPTVNRCEVAAAAALVASFRLFHESVYEDARLAVERRQGPAVILHSFRSDATTASVWRNSSVMGLELETAAVERPCLIDAASSWADACVCMSGWADAHRVHRKTTDRRAEDISPPFGQLGGWFSH